MQNKNKLLLAIFLSVVMFAALPLMSAATTIVKPVTNTNYSGTMNVTVTTAIVGTDGGSLNVTCWYNESGGTPYKPFVTIQNTSAAQTWFSNSAVDISSWSDAITYSVICGAIGDTAENSSATTKIGIDNTDPVVTLSVAKPSIDEGNTQTITWTSTDALLGYSTLVTVASPSSSDKCADQTWTDTSGTDVRIATDGGVTECDGTWTVTITSTDTAGNVGTTSTTYSVESVGWSVGQMGVGMQQTVAEPEKKGSPIVWLAIAGIAVYFIFFRKKKGK